MKVLIVTSHYLPGYKAGGPIRSVANLVTRLGGEFDFHVITRDRDLGDDRSYPSVQPNAWQKVGFAKVAYLPSSAAVSLTIRRLAGEACPDLIYFNSFFDAFWCAVPLLLNRLSGCKQVPVVIAPRGQFDPGALQFSQVRKQAYLNALKSLGVLRHVSWHATSEAERESIRGLLGRRAVVHVAANLSCPGVVASERAPKRPGELSLVFYSRVAPKKNLLFALDCLRDLPGRVRLDICGPVEDTDYQRVCEQRIAELAGRVVVQWRGPVEPADVANQLSQYDAMLLPTYGENFGHTIVESLAAGCPVVISDRTPWRGLAAAGAGWDLSLDRPQDFESALSALAQMDERTHAVMRAQATNVAKQHVEGAESADAHRVLFHAAADRAGSVQEPSLWRAA